MVKSVGSDCVCCNGAGFVEHLGVCPLCEGQPDWCKEDGLAEQAENILALLKRYEPSVVPGVDPSVHYLAPHVPKATWTAIGDAVSACEKNSYGSVDGSRWISLRLDGSGFSKAVRAMRSKGVLEQGFSETFASCMQDCVKLLMEHFHARIGYTQSDEMIVFIPPANVVRGEQQPHLRGGRVTKLTTLAASLVTAKFIMLLAKHCLDHGVGIDGLSTVLPHFDCRLGHYASWEEARALLFWRAHDCSVNGVSDAVYQVKGGQPAQDKTRKEAMGLGKREKIEWLGAQGLLPLPRHQAYGSIFVKTRRVAEGYNPISQTSAKTLRGVIEHLDGPVLELARKDQLFPTEDTLDEK